MQVTPRAADTFWVSTLAPTTSDLNGERPALSVLDRTDLG